MELETQNHVCTNQLRRQDEEMKRIREEIEVVQKVCWSQVSIRL